MNVCRYRVPIILAQSALGLMCLHRARNEGHGTLFTLCLHIKTVCMHIAQVSWTTYLQNPLDTQVLLCFYTLLNFYGLLNSMKAETQSDFFLAVDRHTPPPPPPPQFYSPYHPKLKLCLHRPFASKLLSGTEGLKK